MFMTIGMNHLRAVPQVLVKADFRRDCLDMRDDLTVPFIESDTIMRSHEKHRRRVYAYVDNQHGDVPTTLNLLKDGPACGRWQDVGSDRSCHTGCHSPLTVF